MSKYTHLELNKDIPAPAGYYTPQKEVKLEFNGREVLYVLSQTAIETSCCGISGFNSVLVPGYIVKWHAEKSKDGLPVSEVEPIADEKIHDAVRKIITEKEHISRIEFW